MGGLIELVEGHVMADHVHMCLGIPPKYSVANTVGKLKGKAAIMIHQKYGRKRNFVGLHFWARGYCVSTDGLDEAMMREYIGKSSSGLRVQVSLSLWSQ